MILLVKLLFVAIFCTQNYAVSENILYISSVPSPSHFIWCKSILHSLASKGHNITALSPDVEESSESITYLHLDKLYSSIYNESEMEIDLFKIGELSTLEVIMFYIDVMTTGCLSCLESVGYKRLMSYPNDFKFDLVIFDNTGGPCLLPFISKFGYPPMVSVTPFNGLTRIGYHTGSLIYPSFVPPHNMLHGTDMTFKQRFTSFLAHFGEYFSFQYIIYCTDKIVRKNLPKNFPHLPYLGSLEQNANMFLINSNQLIDNTEPIFPSFMKLVGGAQINKPKKLSKDLIDAIETSKKGFILFSLGSNVRSEQLGNDRIIKILEAFKKFPDLTFLWKFEVSDKLPIELPKNVIIRPWIPQNDVLAHPKIKLFITHSGLLSIQEAMWYGVPILGLPVFGDQFQNIMRMVDLGVAKYLSIQNFESEELFKAIRDILENSKYHKKAQQISKLFRDQPQTPLETATYWCEWVMRHPEYKPKNPALKLNFFSRHSYDILLLIVFMMLFAVYISLKALKLVLKVFKRKKNSKESKKKTN